VLKLTSETLAEVLKRYGAHDMDIKNDIKNVLNLITQPVAINLDTSIQPEVIVSSKKPTGNKCVEGRVPVVCFEGVKFFCVAISCDKLVNEALETGKENINVHIIAIRAPLEGSRLYLGKEGRVYLFNGKGWKMVYRSNPRAFKAIKLAIDSLSRYIDIITYYEILSEIDNYELAKVVRSDKYIVVPRNIINRLKRRPLGGTIVKAKILSTREYIYIPNELIDKRVVFFLGDNESKELRYVKPWIYDLMYHIKGKTKRTE
jgi:hypothetical protein